MYDYSGGKNSNFILSYYVDGDELLVSKARGNECFSKSQEQAILRQMKWQLECAKILKIKLKFKSLMLNMFATIFTLLSFGNLIFLYLLFNEPKIFIELLKEKVLLLIPLSFTFPLNIVLGCSFYYRVDKNKTNDKIINDIEKNEFYFKHEKELCKNSELTYFDIDKMTKFELLTLYKELCLTKKANNFSLNNNSQSLKRSYDFKHKINY